MSRSLPVRRPFAPVDYFGTQEHVDRVKNMKLDDFWK
jgi:hypothetical protein